MFFGIQKAWAETYFAYANNNSTQIIGEEFIVNTDKKTIHGKFYSKKIGDFISIPETTFICNAVTNICAAHIPKIFSNNIGDINNILIRLDLNLESISIVQSTSNIGFISFEADLKNSHIHLKNLKNLVTNHKQTLEIWNAEAHKIYELYVEHHGQPARKFIANNNVFQDIDLSLAGKYNLTFIVKNISDNTEEKRLVYKNIPVLAGEISKNILAEDFYAKNFCNTYHAHTTLCPDWKNQQWSRVTTDKNSYLPWEKADIYIKLRDKYGNRINHKDLKIELHNSVKKNQWKGESIQNNAVTLYPKTSFIGNIGTLTKWIEDYSFQIESLAPTNELENILSIKNIFYWDSIIKDIDLILISYRNPFTVQNNLSEIIFSELNTSFDIQVSKENDFSPDPYIVGKLSVWNPPDTIRIISNHPCKENYQENGNENTFCNKSEFDPWSIFGFDDTTEKITIKPEITWNDAKWKLDIFAWYTIWWQKIFHKIAEKTFTVQKPLSKDIWIQEGIGNVDLDTSSSHMDNSFTYNSTRIKLLNLIEKNIAYLKRNAGWNFDGKNYEILEWDQTISSNFFDTKRSYIVFGGDIIINSDIPVHTEEPVTIITLSQDNKGGNIKIAGNVTNINATLIAEKSILGADDIKTNQLAIIGSIMADNICKDTSNDNCLLNLRKDFKFIDPENKSKKAKNFESNPDKIIIQYNPHIRTNPPPGLENFTE